VALSALNAKLVIQSGRKKKTIPIDSFFVLPDHNVKRENILQPNEIISHIVIPDIPNGTLSGFLKFKERAAWDFAIVSVAVTLQTNGDAVQNGKIVFGGVAPKPWVESNASRMLTNAMPSPDTWDKIAENALKNAEPLSENEYKVILAKNLLKEILERLTK
jgi:xanthine dehydrogenase YagS FAD-binding subunit